MNKIIKYRAYDTVTKQMLYMGNVINTFLVGSGENWEAIERWKGYDCVDEKVIWMFSSGLEDAKGNEIYEGDILISPFSCDVLYKVIYSIDWARWFLVDRNGEYGESFAGFSDEYTIGGNIHEHKHLLEGSRNE